MKFMTYIEYDKHKCLFLGHVPSIYWIYVEGKTINEVNKQLRKLIKVHAGHLSKKEKESLPEFIALTCLEV